MPRERRIDVANAVYHVIARGVEKRTIFADDDDRVAFLRRLGRVAVACDLTIFAYVLMDNHFHLVVRRGATPLGRAMHRLLTGHGVVFNRRHDRVGHLFQNRYRAILCAADDYLLELVRYVHLNPVRAGMAYEADGYVWSSQRAYLGWGSPEWLDTATVLEMVGGPAGFAEFIRSTTNKSYRREMEGLASPTTAAGRESHRLWFGRQVLGSHVLAREVAKLLQDRDLDREAHRAEPPDLSALAARVAASIGIGETEVRSRRRTRQVSTARRALIKLAVVDHGVRPVDVARFLGLHLSSVSEHLRAIENS